MTNLLLLWQTHVCHDKTCPLSRENFGVTNISLSQQKFCHNRYLSRQKSPSHLPPSLLYLSKRSWNNWNTREVSPKKCNITHFKTVLLITEWNQYFHISAFFFFLQTYMWSTGARWRWEARLSSPFCLSKVHTHSLEQQEINRYTILLI